MADLVETVARALWHEEAARAAPNVARGRTSEAFKVESDITRNKWANQARAAIAAVLDDMAEPSDGMIEAGQNMFSTHDKWPAMLAQYRKETLG